MDFPTAATQPLVGRSHGARLGAPLAPAMPGAAICMALISALALAVGTSQRSGPGSVNGQANANGSPARRPRVQPGTALRQAPPSAPAYGVVASADGLTAHNVAQGLQLRFGRLGVRLRSGSTLLSMRLQAAGYDGSLRPVRAAEPSASGNHIVYSHAGVSEWYANTPDGLEQGFLLPRAPHAGARGSLTLAVSLAGNALAIANGHGASVTFGRRGGPALLYGKLAALDARGHTLRSWLSLRGNRILIHVDARGARYPLRIDPLVQQGKHLAEEGVVESEQAGQPVAISGDAGTVLVGGPATGLGMGTAWVFTRAGSTWTQQGPPLVAKREVGQARFGASVALSSDGNTALLDGPSDNSGAGAAWVFQRSGASWSQQAKLKAAGVGVALSSDGNTALVGGNVFTRSGSSWTRQASLGATGGDVALSGDGNTALVGGSVFLRSGPTWTRQAELRPGAGGALSANGNTAMIGYPGEGEEEASNQGAPGEVRVFNRSGSTWTQQGERFTSPEAFAPVGPVFGHSVALSADGNTALIGAPGQFDFEGAAWVFKRVGPNWVQQGKEIAPREDRVTFGESVGLSSGGQTAVIGGESAAWTFAASTPSPAAPTVTARPPSAVSRSSATLEAMVNPNSANVTDCHFEYGTTTEYGSRVNCAWLPGSGEGSAPVAAGVSKLSPHTAYHYRVVAENSLGTSVSGDETFSTQTTTYAAVAWGDNEAGQLGDGSATNRDRAVAVSAATGMSGVAGVSAGGAHSLALLDNGTAMAWGSNTWGALGNGTNKNLEFPLPRLVSGLTSAAEVAGGGAFSLGLLDNGTAMAWGLNRNGQLGNGGGPESCHRSPCARVPVTVKDLTGAISISAGEEFALALTSGGAVSAWGENGVGQLGDGQANGGSAMPVTVQGISGATAVAAGARHGLALLGNGRVMAWGDDREGQLGDGGAPNLEECEIEEPCSRVPLPVPNLSGVKAIAAGGHHSLALLKNGTVVAWGGNGRGQLGDATTTNRGVPAPVSGLSGVKAIAAGAEFSLALLKNGTVVAWGDNEQGQLGNGSTTDSDIPVPVAALSGVKGISAGASHVLAFGPLHPTVTAVSPSSGPAAGATATTITGTNLRGVTSVKFGTVAATSFSTNPDGSITAISPAHDAGTVDVRVTTTAGTSAASAGDRFDYL